MSAKMLWEAGKEYTLRNGAKVQIFATDNACGWPIQGRYYDDKYHCWMGFSWRETGHTQVGRTGDFDLMPPAKPRIKGECWVALENCDRDHEIFNSKDKASSWASLYGSKAVLHVPYDVEEGDGLE